MSRALRRQSAARGHSRGAADKGSRLRPPRPKCAHIHTYTRKISLVYESFVLIYIAETNSITPAYTCSLLSFLSYRKLHHILFTAAYKSQRICDGRQFKLTLLFCETINLLDYKVLAEDLCSLHTPLCDLLSRA